jgi:hypothetical protein
LGQLVLGLDQTDIPQKSTDVTSLPRSLAKFCPDKHKKGRPPPGGLPFCFGQFLI